MKLRYLFMHLSHPNWIFVMHFYTTLIPQSVLDRLQYVLNCAARQASRTQSSLRTYNTGPSWITLATNQTMNYVQITTSNVQSTKWHGTKYIDDLLQHYTPTRQLRSSSKNLLVIPKLNLKFYGDRTFQVAATDLEHTF